MNKKFSESVEVSPEENAHVSRRNKIILLLVTGVLFLLAAAVLWQKVAAWNQTGWVGMEFQPGRNWVNKGERHYFAVGKSLAGKSNPGYISTVFEGGPADKAKIQVGDSVLTINGIFADSTKHLKELTTRVTVGDTLIYRIKKGEKEYYIPLVLEMPLKTKQVVISLSTNTAVGLIFLLIGVFVYWKKSKDRRALVFYLLCVVATTYFFANPVAQLDFFSTNGINLSPSGSSRTFLIGGVLFLTSLLELFLFHLALVFPKERQAVKDNPYIFRWVYGLPLLMPLLILWLAFMAWFYNILILKGGLAFTITFKPPLDQPSDVIIVNSSLLVLALFLFSKWRKVIKVEGWKRWLLLRPFTTMLASILIVSLLVGSSRVLTWMVHLWSAIPVIILLLLLLPLLLGFLFIMPLYYPVATCVSLLRSYRESGEEEKRQVRWPLWGTITGVAGSHVVALALLPVSWLVADTLSSLLLLLIPISFAFAIFKYRLMDIDVVIKKTIIYSLLTGIIVALYFVFVVGVGGLVINLTGVESQWVTITYTLVIAMLFVPARNRVQNIIDRRFFRKKYDYPTALKTLSREISHAVDQQAMLRLVAEHLQPALQNRSVVIFAKGTYDRAYVATAKVGLPDEIIGQLKFEADSRLLTMIDAPFEVHAQDLAEAEKLTLRKAGSAFIVPVKLKNELAGFISLGTKLSDEDYDTEDKDFLTSVAEHIATGFDRVRLREQERDFEKAREIQQGLLPKQIPQLPGYEIACAWQPARAVAGDYYDVIKLSENALGICIADVVGKGMPAALLMSNLQAIVRAMASEDMPPKQLCEKVNRVISSNMTPDKFITFFYCLLDAKSKKLVYTNAGHNRPILFRQDGTWLELKEGGLALGMSRERNYEQGEIELNSGDRLLLFTDGVTEVVNAEREEFGEERLIDLLGNKRQLCAAELQKKVMEAVTEFSGGEFQDDVTLVVVGVK